MTANDPSLRCFEADADNTFGTSTQSNQRSSPHMYPGLLATAQDCFPISNGQSPQLSPELSFAPGPGRAGSCSDWPPQQTNAANNDSLIFSSSSQRYNPGQNHYPHSAARTRMTIYDTPQQSFERGDGECRHGSLYSEDQLSTQLFGNRFPNISATQPYGSPGQPQAYTFSQPDSRTRSGHSSNGSTPTATRAGVTDMVPDIFNSANDTHTSLYSGGSSGFHFSNDIQPPLNLETSNSYYSPDTDTVSSFELTENECLVSNSRSLSSPRLTDSHNDTLENNIQHLSLHRSSSTGPYNRRSPIAQAHLQPKPEKSVAEGTERNSLVKNEYHLPRKNRGRRTRPLEERKRMNATRRRNERTVCIGCKLAKVMCEGREHGRDCIRCTSGNNNAPKPFVCVPASFIELVQQNSTILLALHTIHLRSSGGFCQAISLPSNIDVEQLLGSIGALKSSYGGVIRAYEGDNVLFELDLHACYAFISANYPPTTHPFRQFIDGLKFQRQGHWKACIKNNSYSLANLCNTLFTWDDAALHITYSTVYEISHGVEGRLDSDPNGETHKQIVAAAQLHRIIGRQLELQFYDHLKKALGRPSISHEVVLEVGRAIISLRRRLASWTQSWDKSQPWDNVPFIPELQSYTDGDNDNRSSLSDGFIIAYRIKSLCRILYVYFCYMKRRLPVEEQSDLNTMEIRDPENGRMVEEFLPRYESAKGFEDWLQFIIN
ncbi:hypothetical protein TGAMA5MH_09714 [Trichoderma gamsii]|uniref:Uncharacterized protein n=1 Tax=Trichoderma gamsii TaxID=398673 RepID=A0A2K0SYK9_9HYPO|nr:hypothetical protein TGAMA5MH_09714 [Trichoderma gamsii]